MITEPSVEERGEQPYVAIRDRATMQQLGAVIPRRLGEVFAWLRARGVAPAGAPFIRFLVIDMAADLEIELGVPVASAVPADSGVSAGALPAGRYATLIYTGVARGVEANAALLAWGARQGLAWDAWATDKGEAFGARFEAFLTDPDDEPDPAKWETKVAIRLAESPQR